MSWPNALTAKKRPAPKVMPVHSPEGPATADQFTPLVEVISFMPVMADDRATKRPAP